MCHLHVKVTCKVQSCVSQGLKDKGKQAVARLTSWCMHVLAPTMPAWHAAAACCHLAMPAQCTPLQQLSPSPLFIAFGCFRDFIMAAYTVRLEQNLLSPSRVAVAMENRFVSLLTGLVET